MDGAFEDDEESEARPRERTREGDLVAEIKYPDGKHNCILSDGKKYGEDWVLLSENRDGTRARKKPRKEKPQKKK